MLPALVRSPCCTRHLKPCARWRVFARQSVKSCRWLRPRRAIHRRTRPRCRRQGRAYPELFASLFPPLPAKFAHYLDRFINHVRGDIQRGTESNRVLPRAKCKNTEIKETLPKFLACFGVGQIEGKEQAAAARRRNQRLLALQITQLIQKISTHLRGVLHKMFLLDDAQVMCRAHHSGEIFAPRGIQSAG